MFGLEETPGVTAASRFVVWSVALATAIITAHYAMRTSGERVPAMAMWGVSCEALGWFIHQSFYWLWWRAKALGNDTLFEALEDIRNVYHDAMPASITPRPSESDQQPSFTVSVGTGNSATFALGAARRRNGREWHITAQITSAGGIAAEESGPAGRRVRRWSRRRVDDILLALLGAHERSRASA